MADANLNVVLKVVNEATGQLTKIASDLKKVFTVVEQQNKTTAAGFGGVQAGLNRLGNTVGLVTRAVGILGGGWATFKALQIPVHLAEAAAQSEALAKGLDAIGTAAGYTTGALHEAVEELERLGITSTTAQKNLQRLITSSVGLGTSVELAESAKRIAAAQGRSVEEVFQALTAGISSGTTRLLRRQFGIVLNEQVVFAKKAQELGRELFNDERRQALAEATNELIKQRFAATEATESLAQKQDQLKVSMDRLHETLGALFLPALKEGVEITTTLVQRLTVVVQKFIEARKAGKDFLESYREAVTGNDEDKLNTDIVAVQKKLDQATANVKELSTHVAELDKELAGLDESQRKAYEVTGVKAYRDQLVLAQKDVAKFEAQLKELFKLRPSLTEPTKKKSGADETGAFDQTGNLGVLVKTLDPFEVKRQALELAKASADAAQKATETQLSIVKSRNASLEALDKEAQEKGLLTLEQYYEGRRSRIDTETALEIKKARRAVSAADLNVQRIEFTKGTLNSPEGIAAKAAAEAARGQLAIARQQRGNQLEAVRIELDAKTLEQQRKIRDIELESRQLGDRFDRNSVIEQINQKYNEELRLKGLANEADLDANQLADRALIRRRETLETAKAIADIDLKYLEEKASRENQLLDLASARLGIQEKTGAITSTERRIQENEIIASRIANNEKIIEQQEKILETLPPQSEAYAKITDKVAGLQLTNENLRLSIRTLGEELREQFVGGLSSAIDSVLTRTATVKEALLNLTRSIVGSISKALSDELAKSITKAIIGATGGTNGIFGAIGAAISGENTSFLAQKQVQDTTFLTSLGTLYTGFLARLSAILTSNTTADAATSVAGTMASGGYLSGPSHSGGGININAEGGEYVVNKHATRRWGGLLDAINFGGKAPSLGARTKFADGGMVTGGSGGHTEINIEINDAGVTGNGNSEGAAQFAKLAGSIVQEELVKQKRPGGLLYNEGRR